MTRKITPQIILLFIGMLFGVISFAELSAQNFSQLSGIITNATTGLPVNGAKVTVGGLSGYSISDGSYLVTGILPGNYPVNCTKSGYENYTSTPVTFPGGIPVVRNILLYEAANPPQSVTALLDTVFPPKVHLSWQPPAGSYEIIYDDGTQEDLEVWATSGNMHAVKFTPIGYPVSVTGGSVNIGSPSDYPPGSNPLVPFQVAVYDASGINGMPGNAIAGPFDVIPADLGWVTFNVPNPPVIASGNFYLVMIQGGNAPNAAGISVDNSSTTLRSFQRFVTGGSPWLPANGNFMMRTVVVGAGGPADLDAVPATFTNNMIWRLRQGEEMNPYVWFPVGSSSTDTITDNSWMNLPCGPFLWAVKTEYPGNRWSAATFSNVIGKCWTYPVAINVDLTCENAPVAGTNVRMKNLVYPDTLYVATLDTSGMIQFPEVWKGTYEVQVSRFNYLTQTLNLSVTHDTTLTILLQQKTAAPSNLTVDSKSLRATWNMPRVSNELFNESWAGGNFLTNGWTVEGGLNWVVSQTAGVPAPSAMFGWMPHIYNYNQSLVSRNITGNNSTILTLSYDIMLDNFSTNTLNQLSVELWNGQSWMPLRVYDNSKGSFSWISETIDITACSNISFKIRFRAYGGDSFDINNWNIDNIRVVEAESKANLAACILGYYLLVNNAIAAFTSDTSCLIPPATVQYGASYTACAQALYASGNSALTCINFTSGYLVPPSGLTGTAVENSAFLEWNQPFVGKGKSSSNGPPPGLSGYYIYRNGLLVDSISDPDTLVCYDLSLDPGTYYYGVSARYELDAYGYPGQTDQSVQDGPVAVTINYGLMLPFSEPWDMGSFSYNDWSFSPGQGNWQINPAEGNPLPCARFSSEPQQISYVYNLDSPVITAMNVSCAKVWLDFDFSLGITVPSGKEKLIISIYYNNRWHIIDSLSNSVGYPWTSKHLDISTVAGRAFKIRFSAKGANSSDITGWQLDNIRAYSVCNPALDPAADPLGLDVHLTWRPPYCGGTGHLLNEGFEEAQFPPVEWTQTIANPNATWTHGNSSSYFGVRSGDHSAGLIWDYYHQDEWLIAQDVRVTGDLDFWSFAFQGSVHLDHYYVKISVDNGATWEVLLDMSALPPYPGSTGYNQWNEPYHIDLSQYAGEVADIAWHAVDGDNLGLWYAWGIDDCTVGSKQIIPEPDHRYVTGYDLYRLDPGSGSFERINSSPVYDTSYYDRALQPGEYQYFINAIPEGCNYVTSSDTVTVDVITTLDSPANQILTLYPNPASGITRLISGDPVRKIEISGLSGIYSETREGPFTGNILIDVSRLSPGPYLVRILTDHGIRTLKLVVIRSF